MSLRQATINSNRNVVSRIFTTMRLLARVGLPFRGHDEQQSSLNRGIILELLTLLIEYGDEVLSNHLMSSGGNAQYTSPQIQNEMISTTVLSIKQIVSDKVHKVSNIKLTLVGPRGGSGQTPS